MYEPEIIQEQSHDNSRNFKVVVKVHQDKNSKDDGSVIPFDTFMDDIYFKIKDMYDEEESNGFAETATDTSNDDETFGWSLANEWISIGNVFFYLFSFYNLIDVTDESNIYDAKGIVVGKLQYGMTCKIFDSDKTTPLNILDYETIEELHNKWMQLNFTIKKAVIFNEKYTYKVKCCYKWIKEE